MGPANTTGLVEAPFIYITAIAVVLLLLIVSLTAFFLYRYNWRRHPRSEKVKESLTLEIVWTVIPTALALSMFYVGWVDFMQIRTPPRETMEVDVIARQWSWLFTYENGRSSDVLKVPVNRPVRLVLSSGDVIHSFYVPAFRVKEDCVPGLKTSLWFTANEPGTYDIFCTEYCGVGHSHMLSKLIVMSKEDFDEWYRNEAVEKRQKGLLVLQEKGCLGCHTTDGSAKVGPSFKGLYGRQVIVLTGGMERTVVADEAYIKKAILQPGADIVKGFQPIMPLIPVSPDEIGEVVAYLKELK